MGGHRGRPRPASSAGGKRFTHFAADPADPTSLSDGKVRAILEDDAGALWVGTSSGGLNRLDVATGRFERFRHDPDVAHAASRTTRCARSCRTRTAGSGWAPSEGLDLFDPRRRTFTHYRQDPRNPSSLADDHVLSLAQDRERRAVGRDAPGRRAQVEPAELAVRPRGRPSSTTRHGLGSGHVTSFSEDRAGRLWIGTFDAGLYVDGAHDRRDDGLPARRQEAAQPGQRPGDGAAPRPPRRPLDRHAGRGPRPAAAPRTGVVRALPQRPQASRGPERQRRHRRSWRTARAGSGSAPTAAAWSASTPRRSASPTSATTPKNPASLSGDRVSSLAEAPDGRLWVGTMEKGLNLLDPRSGRFQRFEHRPGDPAQPALGRRPRPVRGRRGEPLGGHAQRPQPPAPGRPQSFETFTHAQRPRQRRRLRHRAATARGGCG